MNPYKVMPIDDLKCKKRIGHLLTIMNEVLLDKPV